MLTRLYIDNFRCFEKFEWRPGRKQLILGRNGTGKTSLRDALQFLVEAVIGGERVDRLFKSSDRTRWIDQTEQVIDIEARLSHGVYRYMLVIASSGDPERQSVRGESLHLNGQPILRFEDGRVVVDPSDAKSSTTYALDPSRSALSTAGFDPSTPGLREFRDWLESLHCLQVNPFAMRSLAETVQPWPSTTLANFPAWYRYLVGTNNSQNAAFHHDLQEGLAGFRQLRLQDAGENVQTLYAEFDRDRGRIQIPFAHLSGQRCLICLYAIVHFGVSKGGTVIIDEPDNFISLREIQPWLMALEDAIDDHGGQAILISHHPEILNQWANPYGVQFVREGAGRVTVEKFSPNPEYTLSAAELVARGWERQ